MADIKKVKAGIYEMLLRCSWDDIDKERHRFQPVLNDAIELLKEQPKKGEWVIDEYNIHHCPFCHAVNETVYRNFCPDCGADMRGEQKCQ